MVFTPIQQLTIITLTGTTCDRITVIRSRIRTVTEATHTLGMMVVEPTITPVGIIITTAIDQH